jgi:hypothetical protein
VAPLVARNPSAALHSSQQQGAHPQGTYQKRSPAHRGWLPGCGHWLSARACHFCANLNVLFLQRPRTISRFDAATGLTRLKCQIEHARALAGGRYERPEPSRIFNITCPRPQIGLGLEYALRSLPRGTRPRYSTLLSHAVLFLSLHDGIPAATSARNQTQNLPTRYSRPVTSRDAVGRAFCLLRQSVLPSFSGNTK